MAARYLASRRNHTSLVQLRIVLPLMFPTLAAAQPPAELVSLPRIPDAIIAAAEQAYNALPPLPRVFPSNVDWSQTDDEVMLQAEALYGTSLGEYTIQIYPTQLMTAYELMPEELDDPVTIGLVTGIIMHELSHICFDQSGRVPLTDASGGTLDSCEHLAIYHGAAVNSCELADILFDAACASKRGQPLADALEVVRGLCKTIEDAQEKYNKPDGVDLAETCLCGASAFIRPPGCTNAFPPDIPRGGSCASGFPADSKVIPDCSVCSLACGG